MSHVCILWRYLRFLPKYHLKYPPHPPYPHLNPPTHPPHPHLSLYPTLCCHTKGNPGLCINNEHRFPTGLIVFNFSVYFLL